MKLITKIVIGAGAVGFGLLGVSAPATAAPSAAASSASVPGATLEGEFKGTAPGGGRLNFYANASSDELMVDFYNRIPGDRVSLPAHGTSGQVKFLSGADAGMCLKASQPSAGNNRGYVTSCSAADTIITMTAAGNLQRPDGLLLSSSGAATAWGTLPGAAKFTASDYRRVEPAPAPLNVTNPAPDAAFGNRDVEAGTRYVTQFKVQSPFAPVGSVNLSWSLSNGATFVEARTWERSNAGAERYINGVLSTGNSKLQFIKYDGNLVSNMSGRQLQAVVEIPAGAKIGDKFVVTTAIDTVGTGKTNTGSPITQSITLTVTKEAPRVVVPVEISGPVEGETVESNKPVFSGVGEPNSEVVIRDEDGTELGRTTVGEDGNWSVPSTVALPEGPQKAVAEQTAPDGTTSTDDVNYIVGEQADTPVIDPMIAGGFGLALTAAAGTLVLIRRKKTANQG